MKLRFTLRQLDYLVAAGQAGSITLAAERLNVSAPSISTAIAQLEAEFGLPLFVRKHTHGMSPTQSGREMIHQAAAALTAASRLTELAAQYRGTVRGRLTIGCLLTFAPVLVPQLRRGFIVRYREVDFLQSEAHQAALIQGLRDATLDVALTYDLALPSDLEFNGLASLQPFVMWSETHPMAQRTQLSVKDLADLPWVLLDLPLSADYFLSFFEKASLKPRIVERSRDLAVVQSLVANDFGYSIANLKTLTNHAPDGKKLAFVPLTGPVRPMRMGLLCANGSRASLTIRTFIDHAQNALQTILHDLILR